MTPHAIETAISELQNLLNQEHEGESSYQEFFEKYPIVFNLMGYKNVYPHIQLVAEDKRFIPDFILEKQEGLFEICDIKLPTEKILKLTNNREEFYSKISTDYVGQLRNYASF